MIAPSPRVAALRRLLCLYIPLAVIGILLVLANIGAVNGGLIGGLFVACLAVTVAANDLETNV